jgi:hypothetical protein
VALQQYAFAAIKQLRQVEALGSERRAKLARVFSHGCACRGTDNRIAVAGRNADGPVARREFFEVVLLVGNRAVIKIGKIAKHSDAQLRERG